MRTTQDTSEAMRPSQVRGAGAFQEIRNNDMLETAAPTPTRMLQVAYAFWQSKVLLSAVELDVFTKLGDGPLNLESLRRRVGIHERGSARFLRRVGGNGVFVS